MMPLKQKIAQLEALHLQVEHAKQEEEQKGHEWQVAEQQARETELKMELEILRLEEEEKRR